MTSHQKKSRLEHDLRAIWLDGVAWALMVGLGEVYIPAFMLACGGSALEAGLVASVPMVVGALLQLVSPAWIRRIRSHKRWVVRCAALQASAFVLLAGAALFDAATPITVFLGATLYWGAGLATGPAWNTWVDTLVPRRVRIRYFARRNRFLHVFQLVGLLVAGGLLQTGVAHHMELPAFALVFVLAAVARLVSTWLLASQSEPDPLPAAMRAVSAREFTARLYNRHDGRLLAYIAAAQFAAYLAAPYFTPYMLGVLRFTYLEYMGLLAAAVLGKFLSQSLCGRIAERRGTHAVLWFGGVGIIPVAALWLVSDAWGYLLCAQFAAGVVWGAWELATFLLLFESIDARERTSVLTLHNCTNAAALAGGSLVGGALLNAQAGTAYGFLLLFGLSSLARVLTLWLLARAAPRRSG